MELATLACIVYCWNEVKITYRYYGQACMMRIYRLGPERRAQRSTIYGVENHSSHILLCQRPEIISLDGRNGGVILHETYAPNLSIYLVTNG